MPERRDWHSLPSWKTCQAMASAGPPLQHPDLSSGSIEAGPASGLQVSGGWQLAGAVHASRVSRDHGMDSLGRKGWGGLAGFLEPLENVRKASISVALGEGTES